MDGNEWYSCNRTRPMLGHLREQGLLSSRKQVLLACASLGPASLQDPYYQLAARFVDGKATLADIEAALAALQREADEDPYFWDRFHSTHADEVFRRRNLMEIARGNENLLDLEI